MRKAHPIAWLLLAFLLLPGPAARAEPLLIEGAVHVQVKGQVKRPGVYRLRPGARGADAIRAAGGPLPGAELSGLNLAAALADGEALDVPRHGALPTTSEASPLHKARRARSAARGAGTPRQVALNAASLEELDALPGIGPAIAADILAYRGRHGGFRSLDELREVPGIGERKLSRLRPHLRL